MFAGRYLMIIEDSLMNGRMEWKVKTLLISTHNNRLDQLDLLNHEDADLCSAGAGCVSISAGAKARIKLRLS